MLINVSADYGLDFVAIGAFVQERLEGKVWFHSRSRRLSSFPHQLLQPLLLVPDAKSESEAFNLFLVLGGVLHFQHVFSHLAEQLLLVFIGQAEQLMLGIELLGSEFQPSDFFPSGVLLLGLL